MIFIYFGQSVDLNTNKLIPKQLANKLDHVFVNMKYDYWRVENLLRLCGSKPIFIYLIIFISFILNY